MDPPPPLPPHPTLAGAGTPPSSAISAAAYSDSLDSPRSRPDPDDPLAPLPGAKLRLMCSYGGHIIPRPHDKSLCYVGGETRIVVVDRHSSLAALSARLSKTLLHGRPFTLKYQLPAEDLDSLISVATDEDLDNMVDEYDRSALRPASRLRLFLFFAKPDTAASMGALLGDAKSETWFVDALNGSGLLPRGLSDSAVEDCLLSASESCNDLLEAPPKEAALMEKAQSPHEVAHYGYAAPDSPLVENNSSFGSSSSSPSMSNLPPIRVRVGEPAATMEEQFAQISFAPPVLAVHSQHGNFVPVQSGENVSGKASSDDERSDNGGGGTAVGYRKPPLPLQAQQMNKAGGGGGGGGYGLPSPDSVASDTSITSASSLAKSSYYQDNNNQQHYAPPIRELRRDPTSPDKRTTTTDTAGASATSAPDPAPHQYLHQHYAHHHHPVPVPQYYQIYQQPPPQQFHHALENGQQYSPVYMVPPGTAGMPPVYPAKTASPAPTPFPNHYVGFSGHNNTVSAPSYAYEYGNPVEHVFYSPAPVAAPVPSQYQSMTPAAAMALSEAAKQLPMDPGNGQPPQIRTNQQLQ